MDSLTPEVAAVFRSMITVDRDQINQAINNYRDPNRDKYHRYWLYQETDRDEHNLLHYVCIYTTDNVATWMLSLKDDNMGSPIPKTSDKFGATAVMYAARAGMIVFVKEWIEQGGNIKSVDKKGRNILHYCCGAGKIIPTLDTEIDIDLHAMRKDQIKIMAYFLIENGFSCSAGDTSGITPIK